MSQKGIEALVDRWMADEGFRDNLRRDPLGTIEREGFELDAEEKRALAEMDLNRPDAELLTQVHLGAGG